MFFSDTLMSSSYWLATTATLAQDPTIWLVQLFLGHYLDQTLFSMVNALRSHWNNHLDEPHIRLKYSMLHKLLTNLNSKKTLDQLKNWIKNYYIFHKSFPSKKCDNITTVHFNFCYNSSDNNSVTFPITWNKPKFENTLIGYLNCRTLSLPLPFTSLTHSLTSIFTFFSHFTLRKKKTLFFVFFWDNFRFINTYIRARFWA